MDFVHLHVHSPFSFLDGGSSLADLVGQAAALGQPALAITDHNGLSGAVAFHRQATAAGIKPILGAEVTMAGGYHLTVLAPDRAGYAALCRLLTGAHLSSPRGEPQATYAQLAEEAEQLLVLSGCRRGEIPGAILAGDYGRAYHAARRLRGLLGPDRFYLELEGCALPGTRALNGALTELGDRLGIPLTITANAHYASKEAFPVHDLLTCVRTLTRLDEVHPDRRLNAENWLRPAADMGRLALGRRDALANTVAIAERCAAKPLPGGEPRLPAFIDLPPGTSADAYLRELVRAGARWRYGKITRRVADRLEHELDVILKLGYADYFLLVWDVARHARGLGIRLGGRGSAADSAVSYCLGLTEVDAIGRGLLFERFLSLERAQKPDIDLDFDARRRDEVSAYVYAKYGEGRVATVCTYNTFQARSALRDFGKALGVPAADLDRLAKRFPHLRADAIPAALERYPELRQGGLPLERYQGLFQACAAVAGFPRFLGTHLGGLVICRDPLTSLTPLQQAAKGVTITQFDKADIEELGLVKLDLLCLRTLSAVSDTLEGLAGDGTPIDYDTLSLADRPTFARLNSGETIGVFQLESPAQRSLQAVLGAEHMEDVIASVALIRPGPIKGNMVSPFIARRKGEEPVTHLHPKLAPILGKTYGVVLFQEQVIEVAMAVAGFTPGDADRLRRVMTHGRSQREMDAIGEEFVERAAARGVKREVAVDIFAMLAGYASYGFCEAHAAAFATTAYKTAYLVEHHPAHFFAAILSSQPMGYYPPNTICTEARRRGVAILPLDINRSQVAFSVEQAGDRQGIRVGLKAVKGLGPEPAAAVVAEREAAGPFTSLADCCRRLPSLSRDALTALIMGGAFDRVATNRRFLLWRLDDCIGRRGGGGLLEQEEPAPGPDFPDFPEAEQFLQEYDSLGLQVRRHAMAYLRPRLAERGWVTSADLKRVPAGRRVTVAGLVIRPHRPPTRSGRTVVFFSLEDEFGLTDVTMFEHTYQAYGQRIFTSPRPPLAVTGLVQRRGRGVSVLAEEVAGVGDRPAAVRET